MTRVQIVVEPELLREVLSTHVAADERLAVVDDIGEADVLVTTIGRGPLHVSRLVGTTVVAHPSRLVETILDLVKPEVPPQPDTEHRVVVLPDEQRQL